MRNKRRPAALALGAALLLLSACAPPPERRFADACRDTGMLAVPADKLEPTCLCMGTLMSRSLKAEQFDRFVDAIHAVQDTGDRAAFFAMAAGPQYREVFGQAGAQCDPARDAPPAPAAPPPQDAQPEETRPAP